MSGIQILYEDEYLFAVVKQAGMIVNKADSAKAVQTLQDFTEKKLRLKNISPTEQEKKAYTINGYSKFDEFLSRGGIVHRLDKETSGIILVAKTPQIFIELQDQFKNKTVKKKYIALVHGEIEKGDTINAPIGRLPWNRMRFGILPEGRSAITAFKIVKKYKNYTLIEVYPETGRTHQIRVHMQHIGHPIVSDALYAGRKIARDDRKKLERHFLHAEGITLLHPVTREKMDLHAPLPDDLSLYLETLEN